MPNKPDTCTQSQCPFRGELSKCLLQRDCSVQQHWVFQAMLDEIIRLRLDAVPCHIERDILASLDDARGRLPACGSHTIMGGAAQEIEALRGMLEQKATTTREEEPCK